MKGEARRVAGLSSCHLAFTINNGSTEMDAKPNSLTLFPGFGLITLRICQPLTRVRGMVPVAAALSSASAACVSGPPPVRRRSTLTPEDLSWTVLTGAETLACSFSSLESVDGAGGVHVAAPCCCAVGVQGRRAGDGRLVCTQAGLREAPPLAAAHPPALCVRIRLLPHAAAGFHSM
ncbi:hypothetical protein P4O66_004013 [Electrophorus voltai]|uniref:Uncharacterized protein n=1 Tax=Electrophorus voltai TaxID=2609070 RepID=A0AAD8ZRN5_9TELE|nr:hypothetical protein P4O66_004013 [Electrophorus voltai]